MCITNSNERDNSKIGIQRQYELHDTVELKRQLENGIGTNALIVGTVTTSFE